IDYDEEFKKTAPLDFLKAVEDKINVKAYMSGKDFRFGAQAKGKSSTLKNYAEDDENGVWYMPIKDVELDGEKISTTLIKSCLDEGNVAKANQLLGSEFTLTGEVVKGAGRGTSVVGFPTVNIEYPEWKHPLKHGVYSVKCLIGETDYQGVANFGTCPTFGDDRVALEVYFEGFNGDLYGQVLTVRFIDFVREIEEFASADELSGQIKSDLNTVNEEVEVSEPTAQEEQPVEEVVAAEVAEPVVEEVVAEEVAEPVETVEEAVEQVETAEEEQPVEEPAEEAVEQVETVEEEQPVEQPAEEVIEEIETVEEIVEESAEEVTEQVVEEVVEEAAAEETTESVEIVEETVEEEVAEPIETAEEAVEQVETVEEEQPVEELSEEVIEQAETVEEEQPVEVIVEEPAEEITEEVESVEEQPEDGEGNLD
ncbi:MAG: hypothetical protein K2I17_05080, partial [Clostridia bacterium]|nr:hypothetical protein [Clostridia bacterium]